MCQSTPVYTVAEFFACQLVFIRLGFAPLAVAENIRAVRTDAMHIAPNLVAKQFTGHCRAS